MYTEGQTISDLDAKTIEGKILNFIKNDPNSFFGFSIDLFEESTTVGVETFMDEMIKKYENEVAFHWFFNPE